ncbi:hypothetical protein P4S72_13060 [Vibrio sp. PP-XX7]
MSKEVFDGLAFDIHGVVASEDEWQGTPCWQDYYQRAKALEILPAGWSDTYYRNWLYHREGLPGLTIMSNRCQFRWMCWSQKSVCW